MSNEERLENNIVAMTLHFELGVKRLQRMFECAEKDDLRYRLNVMKAKLFEMEDRLDYYVIWDESKAA
jgi:hypothetical protein